MSNNTTYKVHVEVDVDALNKEEAEEIAHEFVLENGLTWDECDFLFNDRLTHVQCNVVTTTAEQTRQSTARDLRHLLFAIEDQSMTVNDLRHLLFDEEQDAPLTATDVRRVTRTR